MYHRDHGPPHFHAIYGQHDAAISIRSNRILAGRFPRRALALVQHWAKLHREELEANWNSARENRPLRRIEPLE